MTTTDLWKLLGIACVLLDHTGFFFDNDQPWWRVFGRLAAPIFFFFVGFARTRQVPWRWLAIGLVLTAAESWTEDFETIEPNILLNFALVRLALPALERHVMPYPARAGLAAAACALLIVPMQGILEYGAEGWLWALYGLSHRLALEAAPPRASWTRTGLAAFVAVVYTAAEIADYDFGLATGAVLAACVAALALALARFRRVDLPRQPPEAIAVPLRFVGAWSLEIYAGTLFLGFVTAG